MVFDVLRATSTMTVALANGANGILPCGTIDEAIAARAANPNVLLAGERGGLRINAEISGSVDFDLGNSPREMIRRDGVRPATGNDNHQRDSRTQGVYGGAVGLARMFFESVGAWPGNPRRPAGAATFGLRRHRRQFGVGGCARSGGAV